MRKLKLMHIHQWQPARLIAFSIMGISAAYGQSATNPLQLLVETSAKRLVVAGKVALSKWDSGTAVEDGPREAQVIAGAVRAAEAKGLDPALVSNFFKAQIEANKIVQYAMLADWQRAGAAPTHAPINLVTTIRPELDRIQIDLVAELGGIATVRNSKTCHADVAKAVGEYVSAHSDAFWPRYAVALDRAMAPVCPINTTRP
jgi:chorismate mutase